MGSLERVPRLPEAAHMGYVEGYLDALARFQEVRSQKPELSPEDICFAMEVSVRTYLASGEVVNVPHDLTSYPTVARLLSKPSLSGDGG